LRPSAAARLQKTLCLCPATVKFPVVFDKPNYGRSGLNREAILKAFQEMSDELGRRGVTCLYLVEGLFTEGKI
jgi:hypothetical protein